MKRFFLFSLILASLANAAPGPQLIRANPPLTLTNGLMAMPAATGSVNGYLTSANWTTFNSKQSALTLGNFSSPTTGVSVTGGTGSIVGSGVSLSIQTATGAQPGLLSAADWTTFNAKQGPITSGNLTSPTTGVTIGSGTGAVLGTGTTVSIQTATGAQPGLLSAADWTTFNSKQSSLSLGNLTSGTTGLSVTGGTGSVVGTGVTLTIQTATGSQPGLLSAADWTTFNGKQAAGNYITALTGDVSASGPGSAAATISDTTVTGKLLTGFSASAGTVAATDSILIGFNKVVGNIALKANAASPTFTGTITTPLTASLPVFTNASSQLTTNAITGTGNVVMSASPTLTGTAVLASATVSGSLKSGNYHIEPSENNAGNSSTAQTIDWSNGSAQLSTLTGNVTYTFSNGVTGGAYVLKINTGAGSFTATWPAAVHWSGGTAPTITATASKVDLVNFYFDGTTWFGTISQNYSP